jgi:adenine phosphoribosyltransferase
MTSSNPASVTPPFDLTTCIRDVPDFPKPGITFKDISPLLANPLALQYSITALAEKVQTLGITAVAGIESRGFLFGPGVALALQARFIPIRKPGKLPWKVHRHEYDLEYGSDAIEIHQDAVDESDTVFVIDDVLATGGTLRAACQLIETCGAKVAAAGVVVDLAFLGGTPTIPVPVHSLLEYS